MMTGFTTKQNMIEGVRFQVLKAARMKIAVILVVAPCSLIEVYRRFGGGWLGPQPDEEVGLR
jgi:hypothetical protein